MTSDLQVGTVTNWTESVGISEWIPDQRPFIHLPTSVDSCIGSQIGIPLQRAHSSINPLMWIGFRVTDWHFLTSLSIKTQRSRNAQNTGILALRDLFCHCKIALCIQRSTTTGGILGHVNCTTECFSSALSTPLLHMLHLLPPWAIDSLPQFYPTGAMLPPATNLEAPQILILLLWNRQRCFKHSKHSK
jgi:hypothetical protein